MPLLFLFPVYTAKYFITPCLSYVFIAFICPVVVYTITATLIVVFCVSFP